MHVFGASYVQSLVDLGNFTTLNKRNRRIYLSYIEYCVEVLGAWEVM
jgi:hypothetical protein